MSRASWSARDWQDALLDARSSNLLAALGLSLSPGPNGLLALTHGALHGRRKALFTIFGGAFGFVAVIALSMFGIGALLKASLEWLTVMKWVGGAYLVWLGIQVWRSPPIGIDVSGSVEPRTGRSLFRQGALSALTNPKGLLFFTAFLLFARFVPFIAMSEVKGVLAEQRHGVRSMRAGD